MLARGINTDNFADIMEKMRAAAEDPAAGKAETASEESLSEYFSTHPATQQRIDRFRQAAK